jgi:hypothetical protein
MLIDTHISEEALMTFKIVHSARKTAILQSAADKCL